MALPGIVVCTALHSFIIVESDRIKRAGTRIILVNRRDYPGDLLYSDPELTVLTGAVTSLPDDPDAAISSTSGALGRSLAERALRASWSRMGMKSFSEYGWSRYCIYNHAPSITGNPTRPDFHSSLLVGQRTLFTAASAGIRF